MTKVVLNHALPMIDRDSFLTPFDKMFDQIVEASFPDVTKTCLLYTSPSPRDS